MAMPKLSPPIKRPEFVSPHKTVDVHHGTPAQLFSIRMELLYAANYNDPAYFRRSSSGG